MIAGRNATPQTRANRSATSSASTARCRCNMRRYLGRLVQGDLGRSYARKTEVGRAHRQPPAGDPAADAGRHHRRAADRPSGRHLRRDAAAARPADKAAMTLLLRRRLHAAVRGRPDAALSSSPICWTGFRLAATAALQPSDPAGADPGHRRRRLVFAHDALLDGRGAAPGLYPHRARQGPVGAARRSSSMPCAMPSCRSSP